MKKIILLCAILFPFLGTAQEIPNTDFFIGIPDANIPEIPALPMEIPFTQFDLPEVNIFARNEKREVNMLGIMSREKQLRERRGEYETPAFFTRRKESSFQIKDNVHLYNRGSNYDFYTGKLKNPVYQEMQARLFNDIYTPYYYRRNPYYSPFFR